MARYWEAGEKRTFAPETLARMAAVPCVPGAVKKCRCGATLKTSLDVQIHVCDLELTTRRRIRGDRETRCAL